MAEKKKDLIENVEVMKVKDSRIKQVLDTINDNVTPENVQRYVLGIKKTGHPRAIYDVIKDVMQSKKKKKKKKKGKNLDNSYGLYLQFKDSKRKKKKKKKNRDKGKFWNI